MARGYDEETAIRIPEGFLRNQKAALPFPLRPRHPRPDPPLAEVQVAEEKRLLNLGAEVEEVGDPGSWYNLNRRDRSGGEAFRRSARLFPERA